MLGSATNTESGFFWMRSDGLLPCSRLTPQPVWRGELFGDLNHVALEASEERRKNRARTVPKKK